MTTNRSGFKRGSGCYTCSCCGKRTRDTEGGNGACKLCADCYNRAGDENAVSDGLMTGAEFHARWGVWPEGSDGSEWADSTNTQ